MRNMKIAPLVFERIKAVADFYDNRYYWLFLSEHRRYRGKKILMEPIKSKIENEF